MANQIEYIKDSDLLFQGTKKINDFAIDPANRAETNSENAIATSDEAKVIAEAAESKSDSTQVQLDTIVIEGDSSVEAAQARENGDGKVYTVLRERINTEMGRTSIFREEELSVMEKMNNEFTEHDINPKRYGAVGDGVTDDTEALLKAVEELNKSGGTLFIPTGIFITNQELVITHHGTKVVGNGAYWSSGQGFGSVIRAGSEFSGENILTIENIAHGFIRSIGLLNLTIDGGDSSDANGIKINTAYDFCYFENVMSQSIADDKHAWWITADFGKLGQTHTYINCKGRHRTDDAGNSTFLIERLNESVFINCKSWAGSKSVYQSSATCFYIKECNGITFYNPSSVFTSGSGFTFDTGVVGKGSNIQLYNPLFEDCKKPIEFITNSFKLFGTIQNIVPLNSYVKQGTVKAKVSFVSNSGIYVYDATGIFSTGKIYDESDVEIGVISTVNHWKNEFIKILNPQTKYSSFDKVDYIFKNIKNANIEIDNNSLKPFTIDLKDTSENINLKLNEPQQFSDIGIYNTVDINGYQRVIDLSMTTGIYYLPIAISGMEVTLINNRSTRVNINPKNSNETIDGVTGIEISSGTRLVLTCDKSGNWQIVKIIGRLLKKINANYDSLIVDLPLMTNDFSTSAQIGFDHTGNIITNRGATGYVSFNLSNSTTIPGAKFTFVKDANFTLVITPNGVDSFRGKAKGAAVTLTNVGESLTIINSSPNIWDII